MISGGRKRPPSRAAHRALIGLVLALALVNLALWLTAGSRGAAGSSRAVIRQEFGTGPLGGCMLRIAWRESRLDAHAANWADHHADGSRGSFGLFQIGALWRARGEPVSSFAQRMFDPATNAQLAHRLYAHAGLAPWGGYC